MLDAGAILQDVGTNMLEQASGGMDAAVPIIATLAGLGIAFKLFKRFTGART